MRLKSLFTIRKRPILYLLSTHHIFERQSEVLQMISVQQRVKRRVQMAQDNTRVEQGQGHLTRCAVGLYEVDGVQGHPADDEEENYDGQVLGGFDLTLAGGA